MKQILQNELSKKIHSKIVEELLKEFEEVQNDFSTNDNIKILASSGRFVEIVFAAISYVNNKVLLDLNNIDVNKLYNKIKNLQRNKSGEEDLLYLEIPRVARAIYTIRNKKRGMHRKDLDSIIQDKVFLKYSVDWILSSFIFLFHTRLDKEIQGIIETIVQKKISLIEEFEDGGIMILKKLSFSQKLLVILYKQNNMISKKELRSLSQPKYAQEFNTNLNNLHKSLLIYMNGNNVKINQNGVKEVEKSILKDYN